MELINLMDLSNPDGARLKQDPEHNRVVHAGEPCPDDEEMCRDCGQAHEDPAVCIPHPGWNHPMCLRCWRVEHMDRDPVRLRESETETCCTCGRPTTHGIYVRGEPHR